MPVAKEQIRQIIADNNLNSVADICTLLKDGRILSRAAYVMQGCTAGRPFSYRISRHCSFVAYF